VRVGRGFRPSWRIAAKVHDGVRVIFGDCLELMNAMRRQPGGSGRRYDAELGPAVDHMCAIKKALDRKRPLRLEKIFAWRASPGLAAGNRALDQSDSIDH
jgi:hypothetical protein